MVGLWWQSAPPEVPVSSLFFELVYWGLLIVLGSNPVKTPDLSVGVFSWVSFALSEVVLANRLAWSRFLGWWGITSLHIVHHTSVGATLKFWKDCVNVRRFLLVLVYFRQFLLVANWRSVVLSWVGKILSPDCGLWLLGWVHKGCIYTQLTLSNCSNWGMRVVG